MQLFDPTIAALDSALGAAGMRQQVLANNLSNVNTPGFKRSDIKFDGVLAAALDAAESASNNPAGINALQPSVTVDNASTMRADGNNVDIDSEMANLAENNVRYNALIQMTAKQMNMLEYVISGGSR